MPEGNPRALGGGATPLREDRTEVGPAPTNAAETSLQQVRHWVCQPRAGDAASLPRRLRAIRRCAFVLFDCLAATAAVAAIPEIAPTRVLPVDGPTHFQPSGLALDQGALFTISDKHSEAIYRLDVQADRVLAVVARPIRLPEKNLFLDLEGIVADGAGGFYLVSEEYARVVFVPRDGPSSWVTDDLRPIGRPLGLLVKYNATFEGIALLGPRHFLLAAERDARGVIEADFAVTPPKIVATRIDESSLPYSGKRHPDFADLSVWHGRVFALLRNACGVCELVRDPVAGGAWREGEVAVRFPSIETDPRTQYRDMTYGLAEGLALDDTHLYLVLDNNDDTLAADPKDNRSRLLIFANPFAPPVAAP